jgi:hypothetical protein
VFDGKRAVRRGPQEEVELEDAELDDLKLNSIPVPEFDLKRHLDQMILSGRTTVDDRSAYKITMITQSMSNVDAYFHVETGLKIRQVDRKYAMGKAFTIVRDLSDYKLVDGVLLPHVIDEGGGPLGQLRLTLSQATLIKEHAPGFFDPKLPEPVEGPLHYDTETDE